MKHRTALAIVLTGALLGTTANAQTVSLLCEDIDTRNPYPPMILHIDLASGHLEKGGAGIPYTLTARVTDRTIVWNYGGPNFYTLDRPTGLLTRVVDTGSQEGQVTTMYRCSKPSGPGI